MLAITSNGGATSKLSHEQASSLCYLINLGNNHNAKTVEEAITVVEEHGNAEFLNPLTYMGGDYRHPYRVVSNCVEIR